MEPEEYIQTTFRYQSTSFARLAERNVDFPSTPGIGGAGMVLITSRGLSGLPSGMGKTMIFADVMMII